MNIDKDRIQKKFREIAVTQLRINIAMNALDEMLEAMPRVTAWRGWRYPGWSDEEIVYFRDLLFMQGGWRRYKKNKKSPTTLLPRIGSENKKSPRVKETVREEREPVKTGYPWWT